MIVRQTKRWEVGSRKGFSFWYSHPRCFGWNKGENLLRRVQMGLEEDYTLLKIEDGGLDTCCSFCGEHVTHGNTYIEAHKTATPFPITRAQHEEWLNRHLKDTFRVTERHENPLYKHLAEVTGSEEEVHWQQYQGVKYKGLQAPQWVDTYLWGVYYESPTSRKKGSTCLQVLKGIEEEEAHA